MLSKKLVELTAVVESALSLPEPDHADFFIKSLSLIRFIEVVAVDLEPYAEEQGAACICYELFFALGDLKRARKNFYLSYANTIGLDRELDVAELKKFFKRMPQLSVIDEKEKILPILTLGYGASEAILIFDEASSIEV